MPGRVRRPGSGGVDLFTIENLSGPGVRVDALRVASGECLAMSGPSGAGKTRLLRALADLDPVDGEITLDGLSWRSMPAPDWRRRVVLVPAEPGWWAERAGQHFDGTSAVESLIRRFGLAPEVLAAPVGRLSTGERQRLALARALLLEPDVLLLDEPTSALDEDSRAAVEEALRDHLARGGIIVLVTHDRAQVARLATHAMTVNEGRLDACAAP